MPGASISCFLCLLAVSSACYISNCPIGGKRAVIDSASRKVRAKSLCLCVCVSLCPLACLSTHIHTHVRPLPAASYPPPATVTQHLSPCSSLPAAPCCPPPHLLPTSCLPAEGCRVDWACSEGDAFSSSSSRSEGEAGAQTPREFLLRLLHLVSRQPQRKVPQ
ncbi:oxytocin-neurophysin 1 [Huso huso]|uniref:Oxytocin-neurophysin 1 n=1 Tax=Huso huso TaxID=61971 RepID=A0ABR1A5I3_HUSHU